MSDDVKTRAMEAADKIHRWAFGDDSELADRSAVRFEVERITDALEASIQVDAFLSDKAVEAAAQALTDGEPLPWHYSGARAALQAAIAAVTEGDTE